MGYTHASTPRERMAWVSYVLAHAGEYGVVTALRRAARVSRQTLYAWAARGQAALEQAFQPPEATSVGDARLERDILTLLVEGHASVRGIQRGLGQVGGRAVSLGTISAVVGEAERHALALVATLAPPDARAIALDAIYGRDRHAAYLNIVDVESGAVWVWPVLHQCGQVQGRLDRRVSDVEGRVAVVARQAARVAAGQRPRGRHACVDVAAHTTALTQARRTADDVRYLTMELHTLLEVVVCGQGDILDSAGRQREAETLLTLLAPVRNAAPAEVQREVDRLHTTLERALPGLLAFAAPLDGVQQEARARLGRVALSTLAWTWQRRAILGPHAADLLALLPQAWRPVAARLFAAWEATVRASSAVENWHSVLRPHLAVHRTLPPGLLALLSVWHNHQVSPRGLHQGQSPLQRSGRLDAPTDWLTALGYPPRADSAPPPAAPHVLRAA